jgi:hypothetical protein
MYKILKVFVLMVQEGYYILIIEKSYYFAEGYGTGSNKYIFHF